MGVCQLRTMRPFMGHPRWDDVDPGAAGHRRGGRERRRPSTLVQVLDRFHLMNLRVGRPVPRGRGSWSPRPVPVWRRWPVDGVRLRSTAVMTPNWVQFTYPFNMTRSPAATVCAGLSAAAGLPIGLQLIGPQHGDLVVLRTAAALEAALPASMPSARLST